MSTNNSPFRIAWISSFVPKRCGIATFSRDLIGGIRLADPALAVDIAAAQGADDHLTYGPEVVVTTDLTDVQSFVEAGRALAAAQPDAVVLQHEYGLYGGSFASFERDGRQHRYPLGDNVFTLLDQLAGVPLITTLHTVLPHPDPERRAVIRRLAEYSAAIVTMTHGSKQLLVDTCDIDPEKVVVIPHGVPSVTPVELSAAKTTLGLPTDEPIMMITGLIGGNKGIDIAIRALPHILQSQPNLKLYVVGQTHPDILAHAGESYRDSLVELARELGVEDSLRFVNRYVPVEELVQYLQAADLYLTLHGDPEQAASGTLAYALGAGLVAISTPYRYAEEVLADGRGFVIPFGDDAALAAVVTRVLGDKDEFEQTRKRAAAFGADMSWPIVGRSYAQLIHGAARSNRQA